MSKSISDKLESFLLIIKKEEEEATKNNIEHQDIFKILEKMAFDIEEIRKAVVG